jgi:hypothetical protein
MNAVVDSKNRVKQFSRGRQLLLHRDFRPESPPYRTVVGAEAEEMYRSYRLMTCVRFTEMLSEPEHAESAARTIARMKDQGTWIEPAR